MPGAFELKTSTSNQTYFNLKAANGEVILTSEMYQARAGAENGIQSVRENSALDERFDRRTSKADEPYFVLKAANGEILGRSEMYSSAAAMEKGIASVKTNAPDAVVKDLTGTEGA